MFVTNHVCVSNFSSIFVKFNWFFKKLLRTKTDIYLNYLHIVLILSMERGANENGLLKTEMIIMVLGNYRERVGN